MELGGDAARRRKVDALAGASSLVAVVGTVFHVQGGAVDEIDAAASDLAGSPSLNGEIAKPHDNAGAVDNDTGKRKSTQCSATVDRDRLADGQRGAHDARDEVTVVDT